MSNQYDELKNLLNVSRNMLGKNDLTESRKVLTKNGLISEQEIEDDGATNIEVDSEQEIEVQTTPDEDKSKSYRVSGGLITLHGNTKQELELSTDEKISFQENHYQILVTWTKKTNHRQSQLCFQYFWVF